MRPGHGAHEQDDGGNRQRRCHHQRGVAGHMTAEPGVHHAAARRREDEQEGPEQLGEDPAPLIAVVEEVELPPGRVRLPEGPQGGVRMARAAHLG
jgi:hypothetical protein